MLTQLVWLWFVKLAHVQRLAPRGESLCLGIQGGSVKSLEWLERGLNHDDPMDCLSNCWMGFNNLYSIHQSSSEIGSIKKFIDTNVDTETAQKLIDNHQAEITYFMSRPIIDMRGNGRDSQRDIDSYNSSNCSLDKLKYILMFK